MLMRTKPVFVLWKRYEEIVNVIHNVAEVPVAAGGEEPWITRRR